MRFNDLQLIDSLLRAVTAAGYDEPTPIQAQAIPHLLAGKDLIGCAQTGTGKTAAFALPISQRLIQEVAPAKRSIRALVLSPTRELASQIGDSFATYNRHTTLRHAVVFGGVGMIPQVQKLRAGVDILVATPGRLLDLMSRGEVNLKALSVFVLDEADRMLDMGFIHDVKRIIAVLPAKRQTMLFSATMPPDIQDLAGRILNHPVKVEVTPSATTVESIAQSLFFVDKRAKFALLEHLLDNPEVRRVLVFTRTKHGANKLSENLDRARIRSEAIHGNKSQTARETALANFKAGRTRVLVATDIAARGIDVRDVTHIINYDLPNEPESYVHRIGRTGRAGAEGIAFSFCAPEERGFLRDIERLIRLRIPVVKDHPLVGVVPPPPQYSEESANAAGASDMQERRPMQGRPEQRREGGYGRGRSGNGGGNGNGNSSRPGGQNRRPQRDNRERQPN